MRWEGGGSCRRNQALVFVLNSVTARFSVESTISKDASEVVAMCTMDQCGKGTEDGSVDYKSVLHNGPLLLVQIWMR